MPEYPENTQNQVTKVFESVWGDTKTYENSTGELDIQKLLDWTDGKLTQWIDLVLDHSNTNDNKIRILDAGCGLGGSFECLARIASQPSEQINITYTGLDLIPLHNTGQYLQTRLSKYLNKNFNVEYQLVEQDMIEYGKNNPNTSDLVYALGSLHHTPSVKDALRATFNTLEPSSSKSGMCSHYIGWIINEQKPLRSHTDKFFRSYFNNFSKIEDCSDELKAIAEIFQSLGCSLGDKVVTLKEESKLLGTKPGSYRLQTLLYDSFIKCYYREDEPLQRQIHQLFDWFAPHYYHQTSREDLFKIFSELSNDSNGCEVVDCISKPNGHFFFLRKH